jgi:hypothetical protein
MIDMAEIPAVRVRGQIILDTSNIDKYIDIGHKDRHWYRDCKQVFIEIFGEDRLSLVCKLFAATSINTSLKSNITLFRRALYEIENDLPIGRYLPNIQQQLLKIRNGEELSGRKIRSFHKCMSGEDPTLCVVDVWLLRAFGQDRKYMRKGNSAHTGYERSGGATNKQYTLIENWIRNYAAELGLMPMELCSIIWAGVRISTSGDRNTHYKTILQNSFNNLFNVI